MRRTLWRADFDDARHPNSLPSKKARPGQRRHSGPRCLSPDNDKGISLVFAELKDPVRAKIERYGLTRTIEPRHFFPTVEAAVAVRVSVDLTRTAQTKTSSSPWTRRSTKDLLS
jgi:hypothetical protein